MLRSAELRVVVAGALAVVALALALLDVAARRSDLFLLDFRQWRRVGSVETADLEADPPTRRPFRATVALHGRAGSAAIERTVAAEAAKRYCFRVLTAPADSSSVEGFTTYVSVNGVERWSAPLKGTGRGYAVSVDDLGAHQGAITLSLGVRSLVARPTPAVRFEYASLRECGAGGAG